MLPAGSKAGAICLGVPDVCKVPAGPLPPIPTPFPNTGQVANTLNASTKVLIENKETVVEMAEIPSSDGDQAGSIGGVVSNMVAGKVKFVLGSTRVKAEGKGIVYVSAPTTHNGDNANVPGLFTVPAQGRVLVSP